MPRVRARPRHDSPLSVHTPPRSQRAQHGQQGHQQWPGPEALGGAVQRPHHPAAPRRGQLWQGEQLTLQWREAGSWCWLVHSPFAPLCSHSQACPLLSLLPSLPSLLAGLPGQPQRDAVRGQNAAPRGRRGAGGHEPVVARHAGAAPGKGRMHELRAPIEQSSSIGSRGLGGAVSCDACCQQTRLLVTRLPARRSAA